jgi:cellobiose-specific phosphotransferase system component IIA
MDAELETLGSEATVVENLKKICIFVAGSAAQKFGVKLSDEQELLARTADLAMLAYTAESTYLRALKEVKAKGEDAAAIAVAAAQITCETAMSQAELIAREATAALAEGDVLMTMLAGLRRLSRRTSANTIALKKMIGNKMIEDERVPFAL